MPGRKFLRTNFQKQEEIDGISEWDLVNNNWDLFEIKRPTNFLTISRSFIQRPDLLSLKLYGKMDYWWIIGKLNGIDDWWNDMSIGQVIRVPDRLDIEDFYLALRRNKK